MSTYTGELTNAASEIFAEHMKREIDSPAGRHIYSQRLGTVGPVFRNIASTLGVDRSKLRGKDKINAQCQLFAIVHNIGTVHMFG